MAIAELQGNRIVIHSEYRERELCKLVPGCKWSSEERVWWLPLSWAGCVQLRGTFQDSLQVGVQLSSWARDEVARRVEPCLLLRTAEDAPDLGFLTRLRPFQRAGVKFMVTARRALLADEMGLGKTVQAIATLETLGEDAYPALVVCPNSMKLTWAEELACWAPGRRVSVVNGGAATRRKQLALVRDGEADVAVINWESLRGHTRLAGYGSVQLADADKVPKELNEVEWRTVIADEAHKAKDPKAKQTRALWWVGREAEYRFALTGTPVANSPEDVWTLMRFVSPEEFPAKTRFIDRYALQSWNAFGSMEVVGIRSETKDELFKILDPRFLRRTKAAVLPQLPAKTYTARYVELTAKQRKAYEQVRKEMLAELDGGVLLATSPLARLTRLLQFASAHGALEDGKLLLREPSCKVDALEELAAELGDSRAVVFAESRQLIELGAKRLLKRGYRVGQISGAVSVPDRQENVNRFNGNELQLLLIVLGAGGEGLSFPGVTTGIFLQRSFSAVKNAQAEDRIHGIGRGSETEATEIIDVIAIDTAEARVHEIRREKGDLLEEIARDEETLRTWLAK